LITVTIWLPEKMTAGNERAVGCHLNSGLANQWSAGPFNFWTGNWMVKSCLDKMAGKNGPTFKFYSGYCMAKDRSDKRASGCLKIRPFNFRTHSCDLNTQLVRV
jgi:hypothetical protein